MSHYILKYNVTVVCFCYSGDEAVLQYSLKSVNNAFENKNLKICLIDDHSNPISEQTVERLKQLITCDFVYERSTFNRNHNLNGKECIYGMVDEFIKHTEGRPGLLVKLDPDTMLLKPFIFDSFMINCNTDYMASCRPGCHFSGICYCIKTNILKDCKKILDNLNIPFDKGPEDYIIGLAASCASLPKLSQMITTYAGCNTQKTSAVGWNYIINEEIYEEAKAYYKMFEIVTYGNWFMNKSLVSNDRCKPMEIMLKVQEENL